MTEGDKISPFSFQTRHKYTGVRRSSPRCEAIVVNVSRQNKQANKAKQAKTTPTHRDRSKRTKPES